MVNKIVKDVEKARWKSFRNKNHARLCTCGTVLRCARIRDSIKRYHYTSVGWYCITCKKFKGL